MLVHHLVPTNHDPDHVVVQDPVLHPDLVLENQEVVRVQQIQVVLAQQLQIIRVAQKNQVDQRNHAVVPFQLFQIVRENLLDQIDLAQEVVRHQNQNQMVKLVPRKSVSVQ